MADVEIIDGKIVWHSGRVLKYLFIEVVKISCLVPVFVALFMISIAYIVWFLISEPIKWAVSKTLIALDRLIHMV